MDAPLADNRPETCAALGLECRACVRAGAASVARLCHEMDASGAERVFLKMYPSSGCAPMAGHFVAAYADSLTPQKKPVLVARKAAGAAAA
jgi:hypothetical protein